MASFLFFSQQQHKSSSVSLSFFSSSHAHRNASLFSSFFFFLLLTPLCRSFLFPSPPSRNDEVVPVFFFSFFPLPRVYTHKKCFFSFSFSFFFFPRVLEFFEFLSPETENAPFFFSLFFFFRRREATLPLPFFLSSLVFLS